MIAQPGSADRTWPERCARAGLLRCAAPVRQVAIELERDGAEQVWQRHRRPAGPSPEQDLERAAKVGARLITPGDDEWPAALADLAAFVHSPATSADRAGGRDHGVPFGLWVRGPARLDEVIGRSVAVVGARAATGYGTHVAMELAAGLAERDAAVLSGAAYGVDAAAHRGALAAGGVTVAVLAGGIDVPYPQGHAELLARIAADGLVLTEAPPGASVRRERFLTRNRLLAALAGGAVLVEAGLRSGARNTLAHARALGRPRMAVPGPVTSAMSTGCHLLLRADPEARLVTCAADVLEETGRLGADLAPVPAGPVDPRDGLPAPARALLAAFPARTPWGLGRIAAELGVGRTEALALAGTLAAAGWLDQGPDGFRLTVRARAPLAR